MPTYRVYQLDGAGRIGRGEWIEAANLEQAEAIARGRCETGALMIELWGEGKRIDRFLCGERTAGSSPRERG